MLSEFPTKHASNIYPRHVCHTQAFCRPLLSTVLLRKLTNVTATVKATTPLRAACVPQGRTNVVIEKHDLMFLPRA